MLAIKNINLIVPHSYHQTKINILIENWYKLLRVVVLMGLTFGLSLALASRPAWAHELAENASGLNPQLWLRNGLQWIHSLGALGGLAFILLYIVATVAFLPGSILTLGGGVLFGVVMGSFYVFIGATIGATVAFLIGRYLARGWAAKKIANNNKFRAIDEAVGREGLKIVFLTRLSPVFPFNFLNYAYGVTRVSLKDYIVGSIGMIPGTIMYVYIGSLAGNIATIGTESQLDHPGLQWGIRIIGFLSTVAVTVYVTQVARKALENEVFK